MLTLLQIAKRRLAMLGGFGVGIAIITLVAPPAILESDRAELPVDSAAPSRAERLVQKYDCWTHEAPADMTDKMPGHVVVSIATGRTVYSAALVGPALDQAVGGHDRGILVHAFCR